MTTTETKKKKKGIVRTEFILIFLILLVLVGVYFTFFFVLHIKWIAQKTLSKVYGAEVNISQLQIDYLPPAVAFKDIQFTDHQKPTHNLFEIGNFSFKLNTEDLMFASLTTDEALLTDVRVDRPRKSKGYVNPETQQLVSLSLNLKKNKQAVLANKSEGNILENALSFSKSKDLNAELDKLAEEFKINDLAKKYESKLKTQSDLLKNYETLADPEFVKTIESKLKALETKIDSKASITEIIASGKTLLEDIKTQKENVDQLTKQFKAQLAEAKNIRNEFKADLQIKKNELKSKFKIPDISPEALAQDFFAETVSTRFYLFKYWLDQIRKDSETKVKNVSQKVLSEEKAKFVTEKIKSTIEATQQEKSIKTDIADFKASNSQIIHFGSNIRPKFWIKKALLSGDAKANQDLQNFKGTILNIADDQKIIGKPIEISFEGDLPKNNIYKMNLAATLNHHVKDINETFKMAANYPISSFKIIDDNSLKLYLNKAATRTVIDGQLLQNQIKNLKIGNQMDDVAFLFNSSKSDIQKMLEPIFSNITAFGLDIFLKGAIDNPDLSIISSLTDKISSGLKTQISAELDTFNKALDAKLSEKVGELQSKIFGNIDGQESDVNNEIKGLNSQLDKQRNTVNELLKKQSSSSLDKLTDKLNDKLLKKLKK